MGLRININEGKILRNLKILKEKAKGKRICAVVKANAYGHGANCVSKLLEKEVDYFAVATANEGVALRKNGIKNSILLLQYRPTDAKDCVAYDITPGISTVQDVKSLLYQSGKFSKETCVHLQIDSGMNRFGVKNTQELDEIFSILYPARVTGVYSHIFSENSIHKQIERFKFYERTVKSIYPDAVSHISATSSLSRGVVYGDMLRLGLCLYGYGMNGLSPVMTVSSKVLKIKKLAAGETAGYNGEFLAKSDDIKIAIVDGGYADGIFKRLSGKCKVLHKDKLFPIVAVCMDSFMIDVTGSDDVSEGDLVTIIGEGTVCKRYADVIAKEIGTIPYEIIATIGNLARR